MSKMPRDQLESDPDNPMLSRLMSMMQLNRQRLLRMVKGLTMEQLDYTPDGKEVESIASLLYHIAAVDYSWVFEDIDGEEMDFEEWKYGFSTRFDEVDQISGHDLDFYLDRIEKTRNQIMDRLSQFSEADLQRVFIADGASEFTLEWMFFHLINHEALHLGQISLLKRLYELKS